MKVIYFLLFSFLLSFIATEDKCCETCTIEGTKKYYSIDYIFNRCGECCIEPEKYCIYHIF